MNDTLFFLLCNLIQVSFISVVNTKIGSNYYFYISDEESEDTLIELRCSYSHSGIKNLYASYELYIDKNLIATAKKSVIDKRKPNLNKPIKTNADKLERLLLLASLKLIQQEYDCHTRHMLKTFMNTQNQKVN